MKAGRNTIGRPGSAISLRNEGELLKRATLDAVSGQFPVTPIVLFGGQLPGIQVIRGHGPDLLDALDRHNGVAP